MKSSDVACGSLDQLVSRLADEDVGGQVAIDLDRIETIDEEGLIDEICTAIDNAPIESA